MTEKCNKDVRSRKQYPSLSPSFTDIKNINKYLDITFYLLGKKHEM